MTLRSEGLDTVCRALFDLIRVHHHTVFAACLCPMAGTPAKVPAVLSERVRSHRWRLEVVQFRCGSATVIGVVTTMLVGVASVVPAQTAHAAGGDPVLASGLVARDARPVPADLLVEIIATAAEGTTATVGARASGMVVGRVRADATGHFAVRPAPSRIPDGLLGPHGDVRVLVIAADASHQLVWMFSAVRRSTSWATAAGASRGDETPANLRFDLGSRASVAEVHEQALDHVDATGRTVPASASPVHPGGSLAADVCQRGGAAAASDLGTTTSTARRSTGRPGRGPERTRR